MTAVERKATDDNGEITSDILVNPGFDFVLREGDYMFVIAKEEPEIY